MNCVVLIQYSLQMAATGFNMMTTLTLSVIFAAAHVGKLTALCTVQANVVWNISGKFYKCITVVKRCVATQVWDRAP